MQCVGRFRPEAGIRVQVWDSSILRDQFRGQCTITANPDNPFGDDTTRLHYLCALLGRYPNNHLFRVEKTIELYNRGKKQDEKMGSSIKYFIGVYNNSDRVIHATGEMYSLFIMFQRHIMIWRLFNLSPG